MGLLDFASNVLTKYKADISDHKAKVRELEGEERKLAQARVDGLEKGNKSIDGFVGVACFLRFVPPPR